MSEIGDFGTIVLIVSVGFSLALLASRLSDRFPVPAPALFLIAAAIASDVFPALGDRLSIRTVERIGVVALIVILFDGGMKVGWRRFRRSAVPISSLGVVGTFATAGRGGARRALAVRLRLDARVACSGAALAPTDPAVMFSVLGRREVGGRAGTILEGESGANDPVGIALMVGMLELRDPRRRLDRRRSGVEFVVEMAVGLVVGVAGAWLAARRRCGASAARQRGALPAADARRGRRRSTASPSVAHGSGFLAVFVAGLLVGDERAPYKTEIERFHTSLASLAEIVGVRRARPHDRPLDARPATTSGSTGSCSRSLLAFVAAAARRRAAAAARPPAPRRAPVRDVGRAQGRGADPARGRSSCSPASTSRSACTGSSSSSSRSRSSSRAASIPLVARRLGVPMRMVEPEPWSISIGLRDEPHGVQRFVVAAGARADGTEIRDLPLGERAWISLVIRDGVAAAGARAGPSCSRATRCSCWRRRRTRRRSGSCSSSRPGAPEPVAG